MNKKDVKIDDAGIFTRHSFSFSNEDVVTEEFESFFNEIANYQHDISKRLQNLKSLAKRALLEEKYGTVNHFRDINLSHHKNKGDDEEGKLDLVEKMTPRARAAREVFRRFLEMESLAPEHCSAIYYDLGQLYIRLMLSEYVEPKYKKHKDAPSAGGKSRRGSFTRIKKYIKTQNSRIEDKSISRRKRAQIIFDTIDEKVEEKIPEITDITIEKIYNHLRHIKKDD